MASLSIKQADRAGIHVPLECVALMQATIRAGGKAYVLDERKRMPEMPLAIVLETDGPIDPDATTACPGWPLIQVVNNWLINATWSDRGAYSLTAVRWNERSVVGRRDNAEYEAPGIHLHIHTNAFHGTERPNAWRWFAEIGLARGSHHAYRRHQAMLTWFVRNSAYVRPRPITARGTLDVDRDLIVVETDATRATEDLVAWALAQLRVRFALDEPGTHTRPWRG